MEIRILFPDEAARQETRSVRVAAIERGEESTCEALQRGIARPHDDGYDVVDEVVIDMQAMSSTRQLRVDDSGAHLFFAEAADSGDVVILRGCVEEQSGERGPREVVIDLSRVK